MSREPYVVSLMRQMSATVKAPPDRVWSPETGRALVEFYTLNPIDPRMGFAVDDAVLCSIAARLWTDGGCQRVRLSDSLAAMFRLTSAPPMEMARLPHPAILIEIPGDYYPLKMQDVVPGIAATSTAWVLLFGHPNREGRTGRGGIIVFRDGSFPLGILAGKEGPDGLTNFDVDRGVQRSWEPRVAARFAQNVVAFMNTHPESLGPSAKGKTGAFRIARVPEDVVVSRELRDAARAAAHDGTMAGVRRALAHFVRGHWRNQPCGEGRQEIRRTWVRPHKRGDESLGRVVERITKLTGEKT